MRLVIAAFGGMRPGVSDKLLPGNMATLAQNVDTTSGALEPISIPLSADTLSKTGTIQTIYRMYDGTWLHWTEDVSVARVPIENNDDDRVIFTGVDQPRMTDKLKAIAGGGTDYPEVSYYAGIPAPTNILEAAVTQDTADGLQLQWDIAGTVADPVGNKVARSYVYTFVTDWGEEGPPSDPSDICYAGDDDYVTLTNFDSTPSGPYQITKVRIYRALSGGSYLFVSEQDLPLTTWNDTVTDASLGESIDTTLWSAPPTDMEGVVAMANGMLVGYAGNVLIFNEPYQGHAYPEDYRKTVDHEIMGLAAAGNTLFVATKGEPQLVVGTHPSYVTSNKIKYGPACVSKRSFVSTGGGAMYAAAEGLVLMTVEGAKVITDKVISKEYWEALVPTSIHGAYHDGKYFGFYNSGITTGGFYFDLEKGELFLLTEYYTAAYADLVTGKLYLANSGVVYEYDGGASPATATWEKDNIVTPPVAFGAGRVDAQGYPVTFTLYGTGDQVHEVSVEDDEPFRIPTSSRHKKWKVKVSGTKAVDSIVLAPTISELDMAVE
jgi:hypothetical protein